MGKVDIENYLSGLRGSESSYPFGPEALVFKVMGKMFALVSQLDDIPRVTLKCAPADGEVLTSQFESITPGYYMNKKHWITILLSGEVSESMLIDLANGSYSLVVSKLTKANKQELEQI
ncbi:MmcQ/YjbR family DNA-binding protein [Photobacterium sp.]|uniref:MmcQ/YjbR family DNA-binding protein n=1 Tax=Photobacterium sp. TaxID=660 RepID=UPI00299D9997|nr:MmcQ/YjbR family DNA-binding protein [Photobacterium sp.]MDX1301818.1 MmcQ/YjbR family DNA-binding protein [Photobacterium sp.]